MAKDRIPGGLAAGKPDRDYVRDKLREGSAVEREHTNNPSIAKEIAKDHLEEDPEYYKKLKQVEAQHKLAAAFADELNKLASRCPVPR